MTPVCTPWLSPMLTVYNDQIAARPQPDNLPPEPDSLDRFIGSSVSKTLTALSAWAGYGLTVFGGVACFSGVGNVVGIPCVVTGVLLAKLGSAGYEKSYEKSINAWDREAALAMNKGTTEVGRYAVGDVHLRKSCVAFWLAPIGGTIYSRNEIGMPPDQPKELLSRMTKERQEGLHVCCGYITEKEAEERRNMLHGVLIN